MAHRFDFQAYIAQHKDPKDRTRAFSFGDYAFRGDIKSLRTLDTLVPVRLAVAGTMQLWGGWGRSGVLKDAVRATEREASRVYTLGHEAARSLHLAPVQLYVTHHLEGWTAQALGDQRESFVALSHDAVRTLSDTELSFEIGRQLGHIQNGHTVYLTAAFYADEVASAIVRWASKPATLALNRWRRRAALTADRAGLLACRELEVAERRIIQHALAEKRMEEDVDVEAFTAEVEASEGSESLLERLTQGLPDASIRIRALRLFATTRFFELHCGASSSDGETLTDIDDAVEAMLRGRLGKSAQEQE